MIIPQVVKSNAAPRGDMGQQYLITGKHVAFRRWEESPGGPSAPRQRDYEIVGYLLTGKLRLDFEEESITLRAGDSWLVPMNAPHTYQVLESVVALEATSPPARFNEMDSA